MVSNSKRTKYDFDYDFSSSDSETSDNVNHLHQTRRTPNQTHRSTKTRNKWLSKNALMARENRLKKKLYLTNLEKEVDKLKTENENFSKLIDNQSLLISDLRKEIKYLKSVIANSSDIGNLIKNIHYNTGMSVSTSLDQTLSLNNDYVSKQRQHIAKKTPHPWEEKQPFPAIETNYVSNQFSVSGLQEFNDDLFGFEDILDDSTNFNDILCTNDVNASNDGGLHLQEHNYTTTEENDDGRFGRQDKLQKDYHLLKQEYIKSTQLLWLLFTIWLQQVEYIMYRSKSRTI